MTIKVSSRRLVQNVHFIVSPNILALSLRKRALYGNLERFESLLWNGVSCSSGQQQNINSKGNAGFLCDNDFVFRDMAKQTPCIIVLVSPLP